jgi:competence protein ComEC
MIERVSLFNSKKETLYFFLLSLVLFFISISFEFYSYKKFTAFNSQLVNVTVLKQYKKTKLKENGKSKTYTVLKLKSDTGLIFYTIASKNLPSVKERMLELEIWAGDISFYEYLRTFFSFSKIIEVQKDDSLKARISSHVQTQHTEANLASIYEALFLAKPLGWELQKRFSSLGVSHLIAISGFHLGVLSAILFFLIKVPYKFLQNRYFPYRSYRVDSFFIIASVLLLYLLFLESPPSLLRAFMMLLVGFILYDRGVKIISMQTLLVSVILLLALLPKLFFSLGFWLSVGGVFYIFLFLIHFKKLPKWWQFFLLPIWIYLMMLPYSLGIFANFSLYHPLSILWTSLFVIFYPLSLLFHILGFGDMLDFALRFLLELDVQERTVELDPVWLGVEILLSILSIYRRYFLFILLFFCTAIFIYSIYDIT